MIVRRDQDPSAGAEEPPREWPGPAGRRVLLEPGALEIGMAAAGALTPAQSGRRL
jgi:hypothetical protein